MVLCPSGVRRYGNAGAFLESHGEKMEHRPRSLRGQEKSIGSGLVPDGKSRRFRGNEIEKDLRARSKDSQFESGGFQVRRGTESRERQEALECRGRYSEGLWHRSGH